MPTTGIDDRDLRRLQASLNAMRVQLPQAGTDALEDSAKQNTRRSAQAVQSRPGSSGKYKREPGAYSQTVRNGAPAIKIQGGGTAIGAEFGATYHTVFGRRVKAASMRRRVFGARVKRQTSGKVVGRVVKADLPALERRVALAFDKSAERVFDKQGL
jgi:hypothetical protein